MWNCVRQVIRLLIVSQYTGKKSFEKTSTKRLRGLPCRQILNPRKAVYYDQMVHELRFPTKASSRRRRKNEFRPDQFWVSNNQCVCTMRPGQRLRHSEDTTPWRFVACNHRWQGIRRELDKTVKPIVQGESPC